MKRLPRDHWERMADRNVRRSLGQTEIKDDHPDLSSCIEAEVDRAFARFLDRAAVHPRITTATKRLLQAVVTPKKEMN